MDLQILWRWARDRGLRRIEMADRVVFNEVVQTKREYMRDITVIEPKWLQELAPHFYQFGTERELAEKRHKIDDT